ncbi:hypothetical protein [Mesorhizobium sp.]|uniref:hypothetical protein n=1 Tax=Mesorhizobium sp. TaxID=1871066 RepID=UPI0025CCC5A0|nr:hypothetical protein [Mesorhizobium sp.]
MPASEEPDFPWPLEYLWIDFLEISMGITSNGFGPALITWDVLQSWSMLRGIALDPKDALALIKLGHSRATILIEKPKDAGKNKDRADRKRHQHRRQ